MEAGKCASGVKELCQQAEGSDWSLEVTLKIRTRAALKSTAVILSDNGVLSSSDDENN